MSHKRTIPSICQQCATPFLAREDSTRQYCSKACSCRANASIPQPDWHTVDDFYALIESGEAPQECLRYTGPINPNGYGTFFLDGKKWGAHRLAWILRAGPIPKGMSVLHTCDNRCCVRNDDEGVYVVNGVEHPRFGHLWLGTPADNAADRNAKGRQAKGERSGHYTHPERTARGDRSRARTHPESLPRGEDHKQAKLTDFDVLFIRSTYGPPSAETNNSAIAHAYGVTPRAMYLVRTGQSWKHLLPS